MLLIGVSLIHIVFSTGLTIRKLSSELIAHIDANALGGRTVWDILKQHVPYPGFQTLLSGQNSTALNPNDPAPIGEATCIINSDAIYHAFSRMYYPSKEIIDLIKHETSLDVNELKDINGKTLLHHAARDADERLVEFLLFERNVDANVEDLEKQTPLFSLYKPDTLLRALRLIEQSEFLDQYDWQSNFIGTLPSIENCDRIGDHLLRAGANTRHQDKYGKVASVAISNRLGRMDVKNGARRAAKYVNPKD